MVCVWQSGDKKTSTGENRTLLQAPVMSVLNFLHLLNRMFAVWIVNVREGRFEELNEINALKCLVRYVLV